VKFDYQAYDLAGKASAGVAEANDESEAVEALRRQGLFVIEIRPAAAEGATGASTHGTASTTRRRMGRGRRLKNLAMFTRQLSVLVASGTPLVQSLGALERQTKDVLWREIIASVRARVEEGSTLAQAMEEHPDAFDAVCRSLVAAGESGGGFETLLDRLALLTKKQLQIRGAVIGALIYPALLICVAAGVLCLMLLFVLPRFAELFKTLGVALPPTTQFLIDLSGLLRSYGWAVPIALLGAGFGARAWLTSPSGRRSFDAVTLRLPRVGKVVSSFAVARIARVLGVLVTGKVPLLDALGLTRQTVRNTQYVDLMAKAEESVTRGSTVSSVFAATDLVSPALCEAIRSGETSGQMGPLLLNIAEFLDEENEVVVKSLTSILEPVILVGLGLVVGFVALSLFLPLFDLTSATHAG
jgi:type II secretory pathway component PulF